MPGGEGVVSSVTHKKVYDSISIIPFITDIKTIHSTGGGVARKVTRPSNAPAQATARTQQPTMCTSYENKLEPIATISNNDADQVYTRSIVGRQLHIHMRCVEHSLYIPYHCFLVPLSAPCVWIND